MGRHTITHHIITQIELHQNYPPCASYLTMTRYTVQSLSSKKKTAKKMKKPEADYPPFVIPDLKSIRNLIESLQTHRVNTLTELCRIERVAASCDSEDDARAFQEPMTAAWRYYVTSNQMLSELRGLTRSYPFCGDILTQARLLVDNDPDSNRSWNLAWLCLTKIRDEYVLPFFSFFPSISGPLLYILGVGGDVGGLPSLCR